MTEPLINPRLFTPREEFFDAVRIDDTAPGRRLRKWINEDVFQQEKFVYVGDFINKAEVLRIPNVGGKSLRALDDAFSDFGLPKVDGPTLEEWEAAKAAHAKGTPIIHLQELLTPAQKALQEAETIEITDAETIAIIDYIKEHDGLLVAQAGKHIRNPHMRKVALAIAALGGEAPQAIVITSNNPTKPIAGVIVRRTQENMDLLGPVSHLDVTGDRLLRAVEQATTQKGHFSAGFLGSDFILLAKPVHLEKLGFSNKPKIPKIVLKCKADSSEPA